MKKFSLPTSSDQFIIDNFKKLDNLVDLAIFLDVDLDEIQFLLKQNLTELYTFVNIKKKSGGVREISIPNPMLKEVQRRLAFVLYKIYDPERRFSAYGFIKKRSILDNAKKHIRKAYVLNIDIENFFGTISFTRVRGVFHKSIGLNIEISQMLAKICSFGYEDSRQGLPQGAPTSPVLSNMVCITMDKEIQKFCKSLKVEYTRYVDDLTFSSYSKAKINNLALFDSEGKTEIQPSISKIIYSNRFKINVSKLRLQSDIKRQEVTGLVVNEAANVKRSATKHIRIMLHSWENYGLEIASQRFISEISENQSEKFKNTLQGHINFYGQIRGRDNPCYIKYYLRLRRLDEKLASKGINEIFQETFTDNELGARIRNTLTYVRLKYGIGDEKYIDLLNLQQLYRESTQTIWIHKFGRVWNEKTQYFRPEEYFASLEDANYCKTLVELKINKFILEFVNLKNFKFPRSSYRGGIMNYDKGLNRVLAEVDFDDPQDVLNLEERLRAVQSDIGRYGINNEFLSRRSQVVEGLNRLLISQGLDSFNSFCVRGDESKKKSILFLASQPDLPEESEEKLDFLRTDRELRAIEIALSEGRIKSRYTLNSCLAMQFDDLFKAIIDYQPSILHFSGHGTPIEGLCIESPSGELQLLTGEEIKKILKFSAKPLNCIVLNACYSANQIDSLLSHCENAIVVSSSVPDDCCIQFSQGFYRAIASGYNILNAFNISVSRLEVTFGVENQWFILLTNQPIDETRARP